MTATHRRSHGRLRTGAGADWVTVAAVLLGAGWGSNQFTPMLLVYERRLGITTGTAEALFGAYAAGLLPGLLLAGRWSDRRGRRPVAVASVVLSLLATVSLLAGSTTVGFLFLGRVLAGLSSGAAFGAGTTWLRELLVAPRGDATMEGAGRRAAVAMTAGFALGPLVAGPLAQWAPGRLIVPYLPHIALMVVVLARVWRVPETVEASRGVPHRERERLSSAARSRFLRTVAPMAPWVFLAPAVAFALLPSVVGAGRATAGIAVTAAVTSLTALSGVLIQPVAHRLAAGHRRFAAADTIGLAVVGVALVLAALTASARETWLLVPCAVVFGSGYGLCLIAGLLEVQRLAPRGSQAELTGIYYMLTYLGFAAPYLLTLASGALGYPELLLLTAALAMVTAAVVHVGRVPQPRPAREGSVVDASARR